MSNVSVEKQKIDLLANAISAKSGEPVTMTLQQMVEAVDGIETGGSAPVLQSKTATPTEQQQTITPDSGYDGLSSVEVGAISSTYVGSGVPRLTSSDVSVDTAEDDIIVVGEGYSGGLGVWIGNLYPIQGETIITPSTSPQTAITSGTFAVGPVTVAAMPNGTAGTPSATKGSVSNHSVSVTPSVTNTAGYIAGGTKTGTAVTVQASELVSGSQTITANGTTDVTNLASVTVAVPIVTYHTSSSAPTSSQGSDGDLWLVTA